MKKNYKGKAKAEDLLFPAYYYAGNFYNSSDLTNKVILTGVNINKPGVWYLPSWYEWKEVFMKLGFSDGSQVADNSAYPFKSSIVNRAFTTVNGTSFIDEYDDGKGKVRSLPFGLAALGRRVLFLRLCQAT
ncbi:hypothetical protein J5A66_03880 [Prevotella sp. oral taxon 475]|uniref:hypothetical protein n=1 Tax=Prevotella sp. oral taxon 475 TaxID=712471 RepID=UPI001BA76442|nr:hypothetical protein [Prevotella sp. oral taxon 475]QUB47939.1 hypothetical protein J5A66_03880 [Prevotella sp. oral taxon 475]